MCGGLCVYMSIANEDTVSVLLFSNTEVIISIPTEENSSLKMNVMIF